MFCYITNPGVRMYVYVWMYTPPSTSLPYHFLTSPPTFTVTRAVQTITQRPINKTNNDEYYIQTTNHKVEK